MNGGLGSRWRRHLAIGLVLVAISGCSLSPSINAGRQLRIQWHAGMVTSYELQSTIDSPEYNGKPLHLVISGLGTLTVGPVDANGNASVEVRVEGSIQYSGASLASVLFQVRVAPDGRVLENPDGQAYDLPQLYQIFPLLPPDPVQVGDFWHETYDLPDPLLGAPYHISVDASYARDETLNGANAVVIHAHLTSFFDKTVAYTKLLGPVPQGHPADETVREIGSKVDDDWFWYDPARHEMIKSSGTEQLEYVAVFASPSTGVEDGRTNVIWNDAVAFANTRPPSGATQFPHR